MDQLLDTIVSIAREILKTENRLPKRLEGKSLELLSLAGIAPGAIGHSREEVMEALRQVLMATPSSAGACFFNQLFGGRDPVATAAEMLTPLLNTSMYTFKVGGPQILIEEEILAKMLNQAGFTKGQGAFLPGGSMSNLTAMLAARNACSPGIRDKGPIQERLIAYTSELSHYSIRKNAGILGLGRDNVRLIRTDDQGRMDPEDLSSQILRDRSEGAHPFFLNATAGTTVLGAYDPLERLVEISRRESLWIHVDGALGASILLSGAHRHLMRGIEGVSSLAWNAHKMMGVPLSCSVLLFREQGVLQSIFAENAGYLFQADEDRLNPGTRSLQCGRRNDALKLWAAWLYHGDRGYEARVNHLFELARYAADKIAANPKMELLLEPESVNVCFICKGRNAAEICEALDRESRLKIGYGEALGRQALRLVCINPDLQKSDIDRALEEILSTAKGSLKNNFPV